MHLLCGSSLRSAKLRRYDERNDVGVAVTNLAAGIQSASLAANASVSAVAPRPVPRSSAANMNAMMEEDLTAEDELE